MLHNHITTEAGENHHRNRVVSGMSFGATNNYEIIIPFGGIKIEEVWQFVIVWALVLLTAVTHHAIRYQIHIAEKNSNWENNKGEMRSRLRHAALVSINYVLSLILMFVSMMMNILLLLAAILGYAIGDYIFSFRSQEEEVLLCH